MRRLEEGAQRSVGSQLRRPRRVEGARVALEVRLGHLVGGVRVRVRVRVTVEVTVIDRDIVALGSAESGRG